MYLSYDMTETFIERQDHKISMLRTKEVFPAFIILNLKFDEDFCSFEASKSCYTLVILN